MKVLFWGLMIFGLSFLLHFIIWKIHLPKKHTKALLQIFFFTLIACIAILISFSLFSLKFITIAPADFKEYFHICLFFISLMLAYIVNYSALEVDSPSLTLVINIAKKGWNGLSREELPLFMNDDFLVKPRINDLITNDMVCLEKDNYKLTRRGILFVSMFIFYRKLLNLPKGG